MGDDGEFVLSKREELVVTTTDATRSSSSPADDGLLKDEESGGGKGASRDLFVDIPDAESMSAEKRLLWWYGLLNPCWADVMVQLGGAGGNLFVIHGEALILDCITKMESCGAVGEAGDGDETSSPSVFLLVIYLAERLLQTLREGGGRFEIIFFDSFKNEVLARGEWAWTLRQSFVLHCLSNPTTIKCVVMSDWWSEEWETFIAERPPCFILMDDGGRALMNGKMSAEQEEDDEEESVEVKMSQWLCFLLKCLCDQIAVALLYKFSKQGSTRLMAHSLTPVFALPSLHQQTSNIQWSWKLKEEDEDDEQLEVKCDLFNNSNLSAVSWRQLLAAQTVKEVTAMGDEESDAVKVVLFVAKLLLLLDVVMDKLTLTQRCHVCPSDMSAWEFSTESLSSGLDFHFSCASKHLSKLIEEVKVGGSIDRLGCCEQSKAIVDLFDQRLFNSLLVALAHSAKDNAWLVPDSYLKCLSPTICDKLEFAWKSIGRRSDSFLPIDLSTLSHLLDTDNLPDLPSLPLPLAPPSIAWLNSSFVDKYAPTHGPGCSLPGTLVAQDDLQVAEAPGRWNVAQKVMIGAGRKAEKETIDLSRFKNKMSKMNALQKTEFIKKQEKKWKQLEARAEFRHAKSLGGTNRLFHNVIVDADHPWKMVKAVGGKSSSRSDQTAKKLSGKAEALVMKNEEEQLGKLKERDNEVYKLAEKKLEAMSVSLDSTAFNNVLLDLTAGFYRVTDSFENFAAVTTQLKTRDIQLKFLLKLLKSAHKVILKFKRTADDSRDVRRTQVRSICLMFLLVHEIYDTYTDQVNGKTVEALQKVLLSLGFVVSAECLFNTWKKTVTAVEDAAVKGKKKDKQQKPSKEAKDVDSKKLSDKEAEKFRCTEETACAIQVSPNEEMEFQLKHMGPYMKRSVGAAKDPRVLFVPDDWQKKLLDIVDKEESALVCAPTSCGKTFICYYAMERVLRFDDDSIVVYVSPSNALVNQVNYDILARFGSKVYKRGVDRLRGSCVRERVTEGVLDSQLVVADAYVMETMLMSSDHIEWIKRIKYIIFDEIHCIGNEKGGDVWERIIQLIPCPFLAMSATVGNPDSFHAWLTRVSNRKRSTPVHLIHHNERFSDLCAFICDGRDLYPLNPVTCLQYSELLADGLPPDFYLQPADAVQLYRCLNKLFGVGKLAPALKLLRPDEAFKGSLAVSKTQYNAYQSKLAKSFVDFLKNKEMTSDEFECLVQCLQDVHAEDSNAVTDKDECLFATTTTPATQQQQSHLLLASPPPAAVLPSSLGPTTTTLSPRSSPGGDDEQETTTGGLRQAIKKNNYTKAYLQPTEFIRMIRFLESRRILPALVFNMDIQEINLMLVGVYKKLKDAQWQKFYGTAESTYNTKRINKQRMDEYTAMLQRREMQTKLKGMKREQREEQGLEDDEDEDDDIPPPPVDIAEEYDDEFSFSNRNLLGQHADEIERLIQRARRSVSPMVLEALRRGIGMHHAECSRRYRDAVELLFRMGYLRVVIATQTLALGIHMPCRSTLFAGDSLLLTPLMYKQMSGRAGRRGFDLLGQVILWEIPFAKIRRLLVAQLNSLTGNFPGSATLALRVLKQHSHVDDRARDEVDAGLLTLLQEPLYAVPKQGGETSEIYLTWLRRLIGYQFRFSVDLLRITGLVNSSAGLTDISPIADYLFESPQANIVLCRLVTSGVLSRIAECASARLQDAQLALLLVLAQMIALKPLNACALAKLRSGATCLTKHPRYDSATQPLLPLAPPEIEKEIANYDNLVLRSFADSVRASATAMKYKDKDFTLPFSGIPFVPSNTAEITSEESTLLRQLEQQAVPYTTRSPFGALCGKADADFASAQEMCDAVRDDIPLTTDMIPVLPVDTVVLTPATYPHLREKRSARLANSYLLDYFTHQRLSVVQTDNNFAASEEWYLAESFRGELQNLATALDISRKFTTPPQTDAELPPVFADDASRRLHTDIKCLSTVAAALGAKFDVMRESNRA
eukprot:GHVS01091981.1.p1 GENE.GHVS01091981.1~~GHVS01091981.1.p1  ORF type:complete len:1980 (+),score=359.93 GHVS01091981.1:89-6028(+)